LQGSEPVKNKQGFSDRGEWLMMKETGLKGLGLKKAPVRGLLQPDSSIRQPGPKSLTPVLACIKFPDRMKKEHTINKCVGIKKN
jgi:hypothetical protein